MFVDAIEEVRKRIVARRLQTELSQRAYKGKKLFKNDMLDETLVKMADL